MPSVTVYNLYAGSLIIPGGYYTYKIPSGGSATFNVPDTDAFVTDNRIAALVASKRIRVDYSGVSTAFYVGVVSYEGGGTSTTVTIPDIAATDAMTATLNTSENPVSVTSIAWSAANTVTINFSANPGASTVSIIVFRPS